jgi:hypothetical protein
MRIEVRRKRADKIGEFGQPYLRGEQEYPSIALEFVQLGPRQFPHFSNAIFQANEEIPPMAEAVVLL